MQVSSSTGVVSRMLDGAAVHAAVPVTDTLLRLPRDKGPNSGARPGEHHRERWGMEKTGREDRGWRDGGSREEEKGIGAGCWVRASEGMQRH